MKHLFFLLSALFILSGCKEKLSFKVVGIINGERKSSVYIYRVEVDKQILIDSSKINGQGRFGFKVKASEPDFYQIGYTSENFITLLAEPGEKINISFKGNNLYEGYSVTGSPGSLKVQALDQTLANTKRQLDSLSILYNKSADKGASELNKPLLEAEYKRIIENQRKYNIEFIIKNISSLASIKALYQRFNPDTYVLYEPRDLQYLKIVTDSLTHRYPNSKHVQALAQDFEKEMNQMYMNKIETMAKDLPSTKLDPVLTDISGKRIALSSITGKYVLLAFWSVKSNDCIQENLQLKELYKIYSKKGFEIYQINLDEKEADWRSAVRFDELPWISVREDNPRDPRNAILYNVKSLPANYLYDRNGNIIAGDLHGRQLKVKLEQLFNK